MLRELGIKVMKDLLSVGRNVSDSTNIGGPVYVMSLLGYTYWQQAGPMAGAETQFLVNGSGPLTNIGLDIGTQETVRDRSNFSAATQQALSCNPADWPLIENSLTSSSRALSSDKNKQYGVIGCILIAATSRGNMTIQSADNMVPPIIDPGWLREESGQEVAIKAYHRARRAWQAVLDGIRIGQEVSPGQNVTTDTQLLDYTKQHIAPIHHASSSCAMGKSDNPMAVVDSKGRVHGMQRLRVIDSSSFSFTPPGHTQGVTYAHTEKLVEDMLNDCFAGEPY